MKNTITFQDKLSLIKFILTTDKFTNGAKVKEFEQHWNTWLGSKHSLFVSSGSTANLLLLASIKELYNLKTGDKVLLPACTWVTNVAPVIQLGLTPIFADINFNNFSFCLDDLKIIKKEHPDIKLIFITHLLGFNASIDNYKEIFPEALILEDICESHGVCNNNIKQGSNSLGATYSFYFGHHMTTIEGGMISTNNSDLYELMRMKRSHGMARESSPELFKQLTEVNPNLEPSFLFVTDGYNFRNHELGAVLGVSQLKRLDQMIQIRRSNFNMYFDLITKYENLFYIPEYDYGNSSFCFPFISKSTDTKNKLKILFDKFKIEYRPVVSGNLLLHPFLKDYKMATDRNHNVDILHNNGLYIGNNHFVNHKDLALLKNILKEL